MGCQILRLDPRKRKGAPSEAALPAHSAMTADGVMAFPTPRRQAVIVESAEMQQRRRLREAGRR